MKKRQFSLLFICLFLTGCMSHYYYKSMGISNEGGYKDYRINTNTAVITYEGDPRTSLAALEKFLLYRAAEVTIGNNYDYFIVISTTPTPSLMALIKPERHKYLAAPAVVYPFQYTPNHYLAYQQSFPAKAPRFTCIANKGVITIEMFQGDVPATQPYAFNAMEVVAGTDHAVLY